MTQDFGNCDPEIMDEGLRDLLDALNRGEHIPGGSPRHMVMTRRAYDVRKLTMDLNCSFHTAAEIRDLFSRIIMKDVPDGFGLFPPFYTEFGCNITVGKGVFINAGCQFQDHGGIVLEDGVLIGHNTVIATLNHEQDPERRAGLIPKPVRICRNVWVGANCTILPGVTVGEGSIVAAGAVVTKDVPPMSVVGGVPAKFIKRVSTEGDGA